LVSNIEIPVSGLEKKCCPIIQNNYTFLIGNYLFILTCPSGNGKGQLSEVTQERPETYPGQAKFKSYLPQGPAGIEVILEPGVFILKRIIIKGLFEATTILHDEVYASVQAEKMKTFWLRCKNKFLSSIPCTALTPQYNNA